MKGIIPIDRIAHLVKASVARMVESEKQWEHLNAYVYQRSRYEIRIAVIDEDEKKETCYGVKVYRLGRRKVGWS